jgi:hypothetical protein
MLHTAALMLISSSRAVSSQLTREEEGANGDKEAASVDEARRTGA